jgi:hypothetical protein
MTDARWTEHLLENEDVLPASDEEFRRLQKLEPRLTRMVVSVWRVYAITR